jgi:7-keto-8-aminopelargonate synthetase-like enzyme
MAKGRSFYTRGRKVQSVDRLILESQRAGVCLEVAGSPDGPEWVVGDRAFRNFGSCSYMGLERHPALLAEGARALERFGSNFSISRIYLQCPLYSTLEDALAEAMGRPVIVTPSTTMAHMAALPVLVGDRDLVLLDQFVHASVHMATDLVADVPIELVRHNRVDLLEERLKEAGNSYDKVWYACDGVYSMLGDFAPFAELSNLLARYPKLHLYVDDAHSMSCFGLHGRGAALTELRHLERVVVAMSLSKAFGASGGLLAFPSAELRDRVRRCGGPLMFSGPLPPAALGSAVASAELHLSPEFAWMQAELHERIAYARRLIGQTELVLATDSATPIFMLHYDSVPAARAMVRKLRERGFFVCISTFPAVPLNKPSIRFTVSRHNSFDDIRDLVDALGTAGAHSSSEVSLLELDPPDLLAPQATSDIVELAASPRKSLGSSA